MFSFRPASIQTASTTTPTTDVKLRAMQRQDHIQEETPFLGSDDETDVMIKKGITAEKPQNKASLIKVLCLVYGADLFKSWGCKMVYDFLQFVSPILLK
jgi:hypothetical protein